MCYCRRTFFPQIFQIISIRKTNTHQDTEEIWENYLFRQRTKQEKSGEHRTKKKVLRKQRPRSFLTKKTCFRENSSGRSLNHTVHSQLIDSRQAHHVADPFFLNTCTVREGAVGFLLIIFSIIISLAIRQCAA